MPARRCSTCGINYPIKGHEVCDGCGENTTPASNLTPYTDWEERARHVKSALEEAEKPTPLILDLDIPLTVRDGRLFISSWDVCQAGYQAPLQPDTLVRVRKQVLEVFGYVSETREYWVSAVTRDEILDA